MSRPVGAWLGLWAVVGCGGAGAAGGGGAAGGAGAGGVTASPGAAQGTSAAPSAVHHWTGPAMPMSARAPAMRRLAERLAASRGQPTPQANAALAAWAQTQPEYEAAAATSSGIWARFKDGRLAIVANLPEVEAAAHHAPPHKAEREAAHPMLALAVGGPDEAKGKRFDAIDLIGIPETAQAAADIASWLTDQKYERGSVTGTVEDFQFGASEGALYLNTHGGGGLLAERAGGGLTGGAPPLSVFALMTATPVHDDKGNLINFVAGENGAPNQGGYTDLFRTKADPPAYEQMLDDGELTYFLGPTDAGNFWHYAITSVYVANHWSMQPPSFIMLAVCSSMDATTSNLEPIAFKDFLKSHASVAVGWTQPVSPPTGLGVARFAFDRMLGANKDTSIKGVQSPPERPWDWTETLNEITAAGKSVDPLHGAQLSFVGSDVILAPSIATIDMEESQKQIVLHGSFGKDPGDGKVVIADSPKGDGAALGGCQWQQDSIKCTVDGSQAGYVHVESHDHKSNVVAVTRFHLKLHWHFHGGDAAHGLIDWDSTMDGLLRVDVQSYRRHPQEDPKPRDPFRVAPSQDSKCHFTTTGFGVDSHGARIPITGSADGPTIGPYSSVLPSSSQGPFGLGPGGLTGGGLTGLAGLLPPGSAAATQLAAMDAAGGMPDPSLMAMAPLGKCMLGGMLDPKNGTKFAASVNLNNDLKAPHVDSHGAFAISMFEKKGDLKQVLAGLTLNASIVTSPQGGQVTIVGGKLDQKGLTASNEITLEWQDASGDYPPDPGSAR